MNKVADQGNVFVCCACGKMSNDKYGNDPIHSGWDASCMLNSQEFAKDSIILNDEGFVISIKEEGK